MKSLGPLVLSLLMLAPGMAAAPQVSSASDESMYVDLKAKEKAVHGALADNNLTRVAVLTAVRTVVGEYEALQHRYPASAYADDALWFGGWLSADAFDRFGEENERALASRLWGAIPQNYPASKYVKLVPKQLSALEGKGKGTATTPTLSASAPASPPSSATPALPAPLTRPSRPTPPPPPIVQRSGLAALRDIKRTVLPEAVRVTLEIDREVAFHDERLDNPARVFVDLPATTPISDFRDKTIRFETDADVVRQVRIGRQPNNTTRVVLDVAGISNYTVYALYNPYRLVIECARADVAALPARFPAPAPKPSIGGRMTVAVFAADLPSAPATLAPPPEETPLLAASPVAPVGTNGGLTPPAANVGGGFSMARQLGLGVSRIAIDPGHGGHDPGAAGKGLTEASLVLDVALRLERLLAAVPGVEVILTRRTDEFVPLQERTAIANREGADLFLSIHANASANASAQGIETYFLNFATSGAAAAVAARENAASGQPMAALPDLVKSIALHNKMDESRDLAVYVQSGLVRKLQPSNRNLKSLGVKQAPFVVLIGASMPSVLAEISFLTNPQDLAMVRTSSYRERIAEGLFDAVRKYQTSLKTDVKATQQ
jgi:N-acetylmuramoyl-L-alanine amidase